MFSHFGLLYEACKVPANVALEINSYFRNKALDPVQYPLYDDAVPTLQKCMELGYKNYILSNNFPELHLAVKALGLSCYFEGCIVSSNVGYEKPRIELFEYALHAAENPKECYMIGDNPVADVLGGKSAGMNTILVHRSEDCGADFYCENLSEIPLVLKK